MWQPPPTPVATPLVNVLNVSQTSQGPIMRTQFRVSSMKAGNKHTSNSKYRIFRAITRALSVDFFVFKAAARYRPVRVM